MRFIQKDTNLIKLVLMIILTFGVQILTLLKATIVASSFGTSTEIDAYNFANSIVSFLFGIITSGISTIIIPEYANKRDKNSVNTFITVIYGGGLIAMAILLLFRYPIIDLITNKDEVFVTIAANVIVLLLLSQYLSAFAGITTAFFQCENNYNIPKCVNLVAQSIVIIALICLNGKMTILEYAIIISGGYVLNFIVDVIIALKHGWRFTPVYTTNEDGVNMLKRFVPIVFSGGVYKLSLLIDSMLAASLSTGMITILSYSTQISTMVNSVVVGNLLLYIYPKIARNIHKPGQQNEFWKKAQALHAIVCLMIAGYLCVGKETVFLLLNHGNFSREACEIVFFGSAIYILGQGISIIRDLVYRYFYSIGDTKTPAKNSIIVSVCNISLSLILVRLIGFYGIILGTVFASFISLTIIMIRFAQKVGFSMKVANLVMYFVENILVMCGSIAGVYGTKILFPINNVVCSVLIYGFEVIVLYCLFQFVFNRKIVGAIKDL